jgi:hypothetical protein
MLAIKTVFIALDVLFMGAKSLWVSTSVSWIFKLNQTSLVVFQLEHQITIIKTKGHDGEGTLCH